MIQSFSAKGHPYDNAVMECFFKYLKKEETNRRSYSSLDELKISLFKYIFGFYNSTRPHSNNGDPSPNDFENLKLFYIFLSSLLTMIQLLGFFIAVDKPTFVIMLKNFLSIATNFKPTIKL